MIEFGVLSVESDRETSLLSVLDSLELLQKLANDVFSKVESQIGIEAGRIDALGIRADDAYCRAAAVSKLSGKGTTLISTAKYPAVDCITWESLWPDLFRTPSALRVRSPKPVEVFKNESELLSQVLLERSRDSDYTPAGLGKIPKCIKTISELVLFNSDVNPYSTYDTTCLDRELSVDEADEAGGDSVKLHDAPVSLVDGDDLPEISPYDVSFRPKMKTKTQFRLPSNLNLPDIANISFMHSGESSIAPSVVQASLPELPSVLEFPSLSEPPPKFMVPIKIPPRPSNVPPTKPISRPSNISSIKMSPPSSSEASMVHELSAKPALNLQTPVIQPDFKSPSSSPVSDKPMMDLLSAIRDKDKMVQLKTTTEAKRRNDATKTPDAPLTLAEEMRLKLSRRQKVLSGQLDREEQKASLNARVVQAVGKFKKSLTQGPFSLDNISGLEEILQAKSSSEEEDTDSDWN